MKRCIVLIAVLLLSCSRSQPTYQDYVLHPEMLQPVYERCTALPAVVAQEDQTCTTAFAAADHLRIMMVEAVTQGQAFGLKLLDLQERLMTAKIALNNAEKNNEKSQLIKLKKNISELEFQIKSMLTVMKLIQPQH